MIISGWREVTKSVLRTNYFVGKERRCVAELRVVSGTLCFTVSLTSKKFQEKVLSVDTYVTF